MQIARTLVVEVVVVVATVDAVVIAAMASPVEQDSVDDDGQ